MVEGILEIRRHASNTVGYDILRYVSSLSRTFSSDFLQKFRVL